MKKTRIDDNHAADDTVESASNEATDQGQFTDDELNTADLDDIALESENADAPEIDPRDAQIESLSQECDALKEQLLRQRAEFENARKRLARESERLTRSAAESLFREWLPVVDHLELALQHAPDLSDSLAQGVELVLKQVSEVLTRNGVEVIPAVGEVFNPHCHEAMTHVESDQYPENTVSLEFQRGYRMGDQVLRPSKVAVSRGKDSAADDPSGSA